jgi:hypothetical protein
LWRFFRGYYKNYCYLPLCIFCGDHLLCAKLRPSNIDDGTGSSAHFFCRAFSTDGTKLGAGRDHIIHLWDLRRIREQLAVSGLDWKSTPYPPPTESRPLGPVVLVPSADDPANKGPTAQAPAELHPPATETAAPRIQMRG